MMKLTNMILTVLVGVSLPAQEKTPESYIVGLPGSMSEATAAAVAKAQDTLVSKAPVGSRVQWFDAINQVRIGAYTVSKGSLVARLRGTMTGREAVEAYLARAQTVGQTNVDQVDLATFLSSTVPDSIQHGHPPRVLVFCSANGGPSFNWPVGCVPSHEFLRRPSTEQVFGTADIQGIINGSSVELCFLGPDAGPLARRAVTGWYDLYVRALGASCGTGRDAGIVLERLMSGAVTEARVQLNPEDTELVIREVNAPKVHRETVQTKPATVVVTRKPEVPSKPPRARHLMVVIDGSGSNAVQLRALPEQLMRIAHLGTRGGDALTLGVQIYDQSQPTTLGPWELKSGKLEALTSWADSFKGDGTQHWADPELSVRSALSELANADPGTERWLVLCGDSGTGERGRADAWDAGDAESAERIQSWLARFAGPGEGNVIAIFSGAGSGRWNEGMARSFYRDCAERCGERGFFLTGLRQVVPLLEDKWGSR